MSEKWEVLEGEEEEGFLIFSDEEEICYVTNHSHAPELSKARANLIAAAPELLREIINKRDALQAMLNFNWFTQSQRERIDAIEKSITETNKVLDKALRGSQKILD